MIWAFTGFHIRCPIPSSTSYPDRDILQDIIARCSSVPAPLVHLFRTDSPHASSLRPRRYSTVLKVICSPAHEDFGMLAVSVGMSVCGSGFFCALVFEGMGIKSADCRDVSH